MERLTSQERAEERLSGAEVEAVLERLRETEPDGSADGRPTVRDLAEASGASADRVAEALAAVREQRSRTLAADAENLRKRRLRALGLGTVALAATVALLNVPIAGGDPLTVVKVETKPIAPYVHGGGPTVQVDATLDYRPRTIWRRIVGPSVELWYSEATLDTPSGPLASFYGDGGVAFGVRKGTFSSLSGTQARVSFAYPVRAETRGASAIVQNMIVDGQQIELRVPLR